MLPPAQREHGLTSFEVVVVFFIVLGIFQFHQRHANDDTTIRSMNAHMDAVDTRYNNTITNETRMELNALRTYINWLIEDSKER